MQRHTSTWIVVADAGRARILYLERPGASPRRVYEDEDGVAHRFAVAEVVNEMATGRGFDRLVLVAAPPVLGALREALSPAARARIEAECAQDLSRFSDDMVMHVVGDLHCADVGDADDDEEIAAAEDAVAARGGGTTVQGRLQ